ncbi:MAG: DUF6602 domain-containing protein [Thermodesulfobacteriota bacterium]
MNKIELREIFLNLQSQMVAKLSTDRKVILHPGSKGDAAEINWIKVLGDYLPERYKVDKAFVLDSDGNLSEQIDIVIYDRQYSPFLFSQDEAKYIPAESVYAVFEVKQSINKDHINYAGQKIKSVRHLKRTSTEIPHAGGKYEPKPLHEIIGGILTLDSDWTLPIKDNLKNCLLKLSELENINIGCILRHGGFTFNHETSDIEMSSDDESLIFFFLKLLYLLQSLGTSPALDIQVYSEFLKKV